MIREFFQRRTIRRVFSRYLSPGAVEGLMSGHLAKSDTMRLQSGEIGYVLIWLRGGTAEQISERMGRAAEIAEGYGGSTDCMISGLIVVSFGTLPLAGSTPAGRVDFIGALSREFGDAIKVVHGSSIGHFGTLGGPRRMAYNFVLPEFGPALAKLCTIQFGEAEEFHALRVTG